MGDHALSAECVASTGDAFFNIDRPLHAAATALGEERDARPESNLFRVAQFSPDGTTIVTQNEDQGLRTFVLPPDLLEDKATPSTLQEYASFKPPSPLQSYAFHPSFKLQDPSTTLVLHSCTDQPLALRNALDYSTVHAKYNMVSPTTERYLTINSLVFTQDGTHFVAGGHNTLSIFDCTQNFSAPIMTHKLVPSKKAKKLYGAVTLGCKGAVTALSINEDGMLAAGTTEREIGLYANEGSGECAVAFSVAAPPSEKHIVTGTGIMHLRWSPDGRYLLAAERQSDGIQVYDVRNMVHRIAWLKRRKADTTQKLGIDVVPTAHGSEVWAGGTDGFVRMWSDPGQKEGHISPDAAIKLHNDPVSGAVWHPGGAVLATCSGRRREVGDETLAQDTSSGACMTASSPTASLPAYIQDSTSTPDNRLAVWTVA